MNELPLVSVIVPAYNAERTIEATLKSALEQSYRNLEVVVVDDGSVDRTDEIVQQVASQDNRIFFVQQTNAGVAVARNVAIEHSKGEYIAPLDADDVWYPQKIEAQVMCMRQAGAQVGLVYTWSVDIDEEGLLTGGFSAADKEGNVFIDLLYYNNFVGTASTPLIRRSCLEKTGLYNQEFREQNAQGLEDIDLYLRIAEQYEFRVIPKFLLCYRQVTGSMSRRCDAMAKSYNILIKNLQLKYPDISVNFYKGARSKFYNYLAGLSSHSGRHGESLSWYIKALQSDPINLLRPRLYEWMLRELLSLLVQPLASLSWTRESWLNVKRSPHQKISLDDVYKLAYRPRRLSLIYKFRSRNYANYSPSNNKAEVM